MPAGLHLGHGSAGPDQEAEPPEPVSGQGSVDRSAQRHWSRHPARPHLGVRAVRLGTPPSTVHLSFLHIQQLAR